MNKNTIGGESKYMKLLKIGLKMKKLLRKKKNIQNEIERLEMQWDTISKQK